MRAPGRLPALLGDPAFRRCWTGRTVSLFGDQITQLALPLRAVLALDAGATQTGRLTAAGLLPSLLFSVHTGVWADRGGRRRHMMIAADLARALALLTLPAARALGRLGLGQLYAAAFTVGTLSVLFDVCNTALLVALVPAERYVEGNSLRNGSRAMSCVVGTSTAGVLVQPRALAGLAWVLPSRTLTAPQRDETGSRDEAGGRAGVPTASAVSPGTCRGRAPRRRNPLPKNRGSAS